MAAAHAATKGTASALLTKTAASGRPPLVLALDFDKTLTEHDTIADVAAVARRIRPEHRDFEWFVDEYIKDHDCFEREWAARIDGRRRDSDRGGNSAVDRGFLDEYLEALRPVENASLRRVVDHRILAGVTTDDLFAAGTAVRFRPGAADTINHFIRTPDHSSSICVVSINWSESFIRGALSANGVDHSLVDIYCNDMAFDAQTGLSTGHLPSAMVVASDKVAAIASVARAVAETHGRPPTIVYAGDSLTDLPALLDANVGLLFGDSKAPADWCEWLAVRFGEQRGARSDASQVLYKLDSWDKAVAAVEAHIS
ncbi:hypothetical protein GGI11_002155 [Coemansia sp. RSA 2049]|nr:hypothetical protein GGI11_002155 [Coemansia sp. RSA 2049]KAJ2652901.1 hypothetical protein GGH99_007567 [Coemansia sp. RSA 1285]